jgi:hypothetical protein
LEVQFTNHGSEPAEASVEPVLPKGWIWDRERSYARIQVPGNTSGTTSQCLLNPDSSALLTISVPAAEARNLYVIPLRIHWNDRYLGQIRHALVSLA